jgi:beta-lactamase regulating signal transducer with metallopeptidase domain
VSTVDVESVGGAATPLITAELDGEVLWYSAESMKQFWIALQEVPATTGAVEQASSLNWSGWVAVLFLVGAGVAVVRLVLGLATVARHRLRSEAINDAVVLELSDVLCAELGCVRSIVLRQSSDLVSAATIGWRRPLILLPPEWREWTPAERRSVLAHEIAHIKHNDFLFWLFAQAGLLLHFYHPLVHWLANRLRLEQELAADATAAAHSGGARPYLKTLAELALRQADRPVAWAARTFLPTKGTLMRRVEMLRDTGLVRGSAPQWRRGLAVATLLGAAVLLSGIRPPENGLAVAADELAQTDAKKKTRKERRKNPGPSTTLRQRKNAKLDLTYVPAKTQTLVGLRPAAMAAVKEFEPLLAMVEQSVDPKETGIELKQIDQFLMLWFVTKEQEPLFGQSGVLAIKTTTKVSFDKFMAWYGGGGVREDREMGGQKYSISRNGHAFYAPDDRTLLFGSEYGIRGVIEQAKEGAGSPNWSKQFESVATSQLCFAVDTKALQSSLRYLLHRDGNPFASLATFPLEWDKTNVVTTGVQLGNVSHATVSAWCGNGEDAKQVHRTLQSLIPLAQNMLAGNKSQLEKMPPDMRGQVSAMIGFFEKLLDDVKVETAATDDGAVVSLHVETEAAAIPMMIGLTLPAIQSARSAARRAQSSNNLKQLALAMHNYHSVHKKFPAAVMTAMDGKTKYSWRVALLPFLGQKNLYDAYNFEEPWDSPDNLKVLNAMPNAFRHPSESEGTTTSSYYALTGENTGLGNGDKAIGFRDIVDGASNTALLFDAKRAIPWTKPEDIKYSADEDVPALGGYEPSGFNALLGDGSVRLISKTIDEKTLRAIITRNGKEVFTFPSRIPNPGGERPITP